MGIRNPRAHSLGTVHGRTAAERDQTAASVFTVHRECFFNILHGRVGIGSVVNGAVDSCLRQGLFQFRSNSAVVQEFVGHKQNGADSLFGEVRCDCGHTLQNFRFPVGQNGQCHVECALKSSAECLFRSIHIGIFSLSYS